MSTVYTLNGKVLKNAANDKWLAKKEAPAGFVMNASNATFALADETTPVVSWQGPAYPEGYNGNGKQYTLVNNNSTAPTSHALLYGTGTTGYGPDAIAGTSMSTLGTSTGTLLNNGAGGNFGTYMVWPNPLGAQAGSESALEELQAYMANVTITITDP